MAEHGPFLTKMLPLMNPEYAKLWKRAPPCFLAEAPQLTQLKPPSRLWKTTPPSTQDEEAFSPPMVVSNSTLSSWTAVA